MRYTTSVKQDLIITCYKPNLDIELSVQKRESISSIWDFILNHLSHLPIHLKIENTS